MPALTPEEWAGLRTEWEGGTTSTRALGRKYAVSEMAIRKRAARQEQPGGPWVRPSAMVEEASLEAVLRTVRTGKLGAELRGLRRGANPGANPIKPADGAETLQARPRKLRTSSLARARVEGLLRSAPPEPARTGRRCGRSAPIQPPGRCCGRR
jgi:hypothetical protein